MSDLDTPAEIRLSDSFATIPDVPIQPDNSIINPNQVRSGLTRGATVTVGADGYPQVLQGNQKTFGNGFYVAKPGHDVITETSPANLIFNSNQNVFKIASSGTTTIPSKTVDSSFASSSGSITVTHNLNVIPICLAFMIDPYTGSQTMLPTFYTYRGFQRVDVSDAVSPDAYIMPLNQYVHIESSLTDVTFRNSFTNIDNPSGFGFTSNVITIKYYLLQETAN